MSLMHDYMHIEGRVTHGAVIEGAIAEEQLTILPHKRLILAERSHRYTDWYKRLNYYPFIKSNQANADQFDIDQQAST